VKGDLDWTKGKSWGNFCTIETAELKGRIALRGKSKIAKGTQNKARVNITGHPKRKTISWEACKKGSREVGNCREGPKKKGAAHLSQQGQKMAAGPTLDGRTDDLQKSGAMSKHCPGGPGKEGEGRGVVTVPGEKRQLRVLWEKNAIFAHVMRYQNEGSSSNCQGKKAELLVGERETVLGGENDPLPRSVL